jgi:hypothetical protein
MQFIEPTHKDVLLGRTQTSFNNFGNKMFRQRIHALVPRYLNARSRTDKTMLIKNLIVSITAEGGRFLKLQGSKKRWVDVSDGPLTRNKVSHAVRDAANRWRMKLLSPSPTFPSFYALESQATSACRILSLSPYFFLSQEDSKAPIIKSSNACGVESEASQILGNSKLESVFLSPPLLPRLDLYMTPSSSEDSLSSCDLESIASILSIDQDYVDDDQDHVTHDHQDIRQFTFDVLQDALTLCSSNNCYNESLTDLRTCLDTSNLDHERNYEPRAHAPLYSVNTNVDALNSFLKGECGSNFMWQTF